MNDSLQSYVYIHTRLNSGIPFYVGKGSSQYRYKSKSSRNKHWHNVVNKDNGFDAIKIIENIDNELSYLIEIELIDKYKLIGYKLTNKTNGGEGHLGLKVNLGRPVSEETKQKLRNANLGKKQSQETIFKRMKAFKEKGFKFGGARGYGENHVNFTGYYITPLGKFPTIQLAADAHNISFNQARKRLNGKTYNINGKIYHYPPLEGWGFQPKE